MGKPGFPIPPPGGRVWEGKALPGEPFYPLADVGRRAAHPGPRPREKVWEGAALTQGDGETGSPSPHPVGGFGRAKPSQENPFIPLRMWAGGPRTQAPARERV